MKDVNYLRGLHNRLLKTFGILDKQLSNPRCKVNHNYAKKKIMKLLKKYEKSSQKRANKTSKKDRLTYSWINASLGAFQADFRQNRASSWITAWGTLSNQIHEFSEELKEEYE